MVPPAVPPGCGPATRFGCVATAPATSRSAWRDRVRRIDDAGFDLLLVADHLGMAAPFPALVAAAEASDRLRLGTQVLNTELWNLALLARDAAAVDVLTDGRLELGLGAGHAEVEFRAAGLRYPGAGERVDHLDEAVPLLRRLLAGEEVTSSGHHRLEGCATGVATVQRPVPIMVGGNGDRVLAIAATQADIVGLVGFRSGTGQRHSDLSHFTWDGLADRVAHVRRSAGARADELRYSVLVQAVVGSDDRTATAAEMAAAFEQPVELLLDSPFVMIGSPAALADHVSRLRDHGVTDVTTFEPSAGALASAIDELA